MNLFTAVSLNNEDNIGQTDKLSKKVIDFNVTMLNAFNSKDDLNSDDILVKTMFG